jgi:ParB-like chromosome segregation protein Spo0J
VKEFPYMTNIRKELAKSAVPIDSIYPHPKNVRQGDIGAISVSLQSHGQYRPLIVQKSTNYIVAGNHTWAAARHLGWEKIAVVSLELDDDRALRILLADNKTSDLATYDSSELAAVLSEFARGFDMEGLIWDQDDLDDLLAQQSTSISNMAVSAITALPVEGAENPMETTENRVPNDTKVAQFYLTGEEFEVLRGALHATQITNRNDALMKVVAEWLEAKNG